MEISSALTGVKLREYAMKVEARSTMNYAAATDDHNSWYFNDESPEGIIAPPMYGVAVTWPVSEKIGSFIENKNFPLEILNTRVHYTEYLEFKRPVIPGDELRVRGKIASIYPHRAGTMVVVKYTVIDKNDKTVFTEYMGGLMRGVQCQDGGKGEDELPKIPTHDIKGLPHWDSTILIDPLFTYVYDGCTNIHFPIHTSHSFSKAVGLPGIIVQGTATLALAVREIINREGGGDPHRLSLLSCRFTGMVFPGTVIRVIVSGTVSMNKGKNVYFTVENDSGQEVLKNGYAFLRA